MATRSKAIKPSVPIPYPAPTPTPAPTQSCKEFLDSARRAAEHQADLDRLEKLKRRNEFVRKVCEKFPHFGFKDDSGFVNERGTEFYRCGYTFVPCKELTHPLWDVASPEESGDLVSSFYVYLTKFGGIVNARDGVVTLADFGTLVASAPSPDFMRSLETEHTKTDTPINKKINPSLWDRIKSALRG